ncbi:MAG: carboxymuconolactone decarboxylase family protein [Pseudomonadota bacterium]|nr:carboxymuconolactone decarboxylase family protein [Pseudomonadota bacterium]
MARIEPLSPTQLTDFQPMFDVLENTMGYIPNNLLSMAYWPELLTAFGGIGATILQTGELDPGLKQLVAMVASAANGCHYCQAHTSHSAHKLGVSQEKVEAAFEFESSSLFSDAERAALRLAWHAALQPNASSDSDFVSLKEHYSDREIVEIVGVIALFGFLNRWSDTMGSELESLPQSFADSINLKTRKLGG